MDPFPEEQFEHKMYIKFSPMHKTMSPQMSMYSSQHFSTHITFKTPLPNTFIVRDQCEYRTFVLHHVLANFAVITMV